MQINHEKHCGGSLAAGGAKPPLSLSMYIEQLPHPSGWQHVPIASVWPLGIPFCQITVFTIVMIGICRMAASQWLQHKMLLMHQPIEPVTPFHLFGIQFPEHQKKLIGSDSWSLATDFL